VHSVIHLFKNNINPLLFEQLKHSSFDSPKQVLHDISHIIHNPLYPYVPYGQVS
jgi:hypothetical protein